MPLTLQELIAQQIDRRGGKAVASDLGVDPSTLSRARSGEKGLRLAHMDALLKSSGYILVPEDFHLQTRNSIKFVSSLIQESCDCPVSGFTVFHKPGCGFYD